MFFPLIVGLAKILYYAISVYSFLIVVWALLSWLPGAAQSKLGQLLNKIVYPYLRLFEWAHIGVLGFGPVLALLVLWVAQWILTTVFTI